MKVYRKRFLDNVFSFIENFQELREFAKPFGSFKLSEDCGALLPLLHSTSLNSSSWRSQG